MNARVPPGAHGAVHAIGEPLEFAAPAYMGGGLAGSTLLQPAGSAVVSMLKSRTRLAGLPLAAAGAWFLIGGHL